MLLWSVLYRCFYSCSTCFVSCEIQSPIWDQVWESSEFVIFRSLAFSRPWWSKILRKKKKGGGGGESEFIVLPSFLKRFACILKHLQKWLNLWPFSLNLSAIFPSACYHKMTLFFKKLNRGSAVLADNVKKKWQWD